MSLGAQLLSHLRSQRAGITAVDLAKRLSVSKAAVVAQIEELVALGYEIVASPHHGFRLLGVPDLLYADDIQFRLPDRRVIGREIRVFSKTTSTSDFVSRLGQNGTPEGIVIFAESQTKGRGRLGRTWVSPARKGLWFSVLLRPQVSFQSATRLTVVAATALARAIQGQTGIVPTIKWPNDILIRGRKVSGILTEIDGEVEMVRYAVVGIGINVNILEEEFPEELRHRVTSLQIEAGQPVNRSDLAVAILTELDRDYARVQSGRFEEVADEWRQRCGTLGQQVTVRSGSRTVQGRAESIDSDGALLIRTQHGRLERIVGGDVELG